jgi:hypothetical protein
MVEIQYEITDEIQARMKARSVSEILAYADQNFG